MVAGVFTARWTFPTLLKGTGYVFADLAEKKHLIVWALLAGALWAVANTLTVFAIRDVGLAVAFPLWNANSLIGLFWGRVLFKELEGASAGNISKVVLGGIAIVIAAVMLGFSTLHGDTAAGHSRRSRNPRRHRRQLHVGDHVRSLSQGLHQRHEPALLRHRLHRRRTGNRASPSRLRSTADSTPPPSTSSTSRGLVFWLFLGGFVWVIGDLFQQFAAKYLGIGRGIPLSNTNQLWGLAWGALVFGELASADSRHKLLVIAGSIIMILGALAIGTAVASAREAHLQQRGRPARVRPLWPRLQPHPRRSGRRRVRRPQRTTPLVGLRHRRYAQQASLSGWDLRPPFLPLP